MTDHLGAIETRADGYEVVLTRHFAHSRELVWSALTEPDQLEVWLMEVEVLELQIGGQIGFTEPGMGPAGEITTLDPPNVLEYTWTSGHEPPPSTVRFELTPSDTGTTLELCHRRNPTGPAAMDHAAGWHAHLDWLEAMLDGRDLVEFWDRFHDLKALYMAEVDTPGVGEAR